MWGFLKGPQFLAHQGRPREVCCSNNQPKYVSSVAVGMTHLALICDDVLGEVMQLISSTMGNPAPTRFTEIATLMARSRGTLLLHAAIMPTHLVSAATGDVLHLVQNRALLSLPPSIPRVLCNVAYLVTNTQLLIVNFSQVIITSAHSAPGEASCWG